MSFKYTISDGVMLDPTGVVIGKGYSGCPQYRNDPAAVMLPDQGPIPPGFYTIEKPSFCDPVHGPVVMRMIPDPANQMYGRAGFMLHGDSIAHPGSASKGCIIMPRPTREDIEASSDCILQVI